LNFSHNTHEWHGQLIERLRQISKELEKPVAIMADLQGPRIRILLEGEGEMEIKDGEMIKVSDVAHKNNPALQAESTKLFFLDAEKIIDGIKVGDQILIEDGTKKLIVREKEEVSLLAEVMHGGIIKNRKGVNLPDSDIKLGALTKKDLEDLKFSLEKGVDLVAISFVKNADDMRELRKKIKEFSPEKNVMIVPKIERKEAIKNIDEIIEASEAVMVARGDLGIELPESEVVIYQKEIVAKCQAKNKKVIVATQMMESMIKNPLPTRAEVSDVSNAVIDRADAVMLSGESANGQYPVETVKMMREIIEKVEATSLDDAPSV
jgi:pyruvate kinase